MKTVKSCAFSSQAVVFGFPYLDTLKICQRSEWGPGVHFMGRGDLKDMQALERLLQKEDISGVFTGTRPSMANVEE